MPTTAVVAAAYRNKLVFLLLFVNCNVLLQLVIISILLFLRMTIKVCNSL